MTQPFVLLLAGHDSNGGTSIFIDHSLLFDDFLSPSSSYLVPRVSDITVEDPTSPKRQQQYSEVSNLKKALEIGQGGHS